MKLFLIIFEDLCMLDKILELVHEKGLSIRQFSIECGLNHNSISAWKKGKANPSLDALKRIADYFNKPISYFYGAEEQPQESNPLIADFMKQVRLKEMTPEEIQELANHAQLIADGIISKRKK